MAFQVFPFTADSSSFLASSVIFWAAVFQITFGRLLLERYFSFRYLVIRPKVFCKFLRLFIVYISISLCCNFLYMIFVLCLRKNNQPTKQKQTKSRHFLLRLKSSSCKKKNKFSLMCMLLAKLTSMDIFYFI